ncbi:hypothetical protein U1Q18_040459 [Sarracenia purpurea var. burkii]
MAMFFFEDLMELRCFLGLVLPFPKNVVTRNINAFPALDSDEDRHFEDPLHLWCWCSVPDLRICISTIVNFFMVEVNLDVLFQPARSLHVYFDDAVVVERLRP